MSTDKTHKKNSPLGGWGASSPRGDGGANPQQSKHISTSPHLGGLGGFAFGGSPYHFSTTMQVRDYECDVQGIVNNANYLHYIEHTRHLFLLEHGVSFIDMHDKGEDFVVARMSLQYKVPLRPDDVFHSCLRLKKEGVRYIFYQDIIRAADNKLCFRAQVDAVCIVNGRMQESETCNEAFGPLLTSHEGRK